MRSNRYIDAGGRVTSPSAGCLFDAPVSPNEQPPGRYWSGMLALSLSSSICPSCGRSKKPRLSICGSCWNKLPFGKQMALYARMGRGYDEAFTNAMKHLGVEKPHFPTDDHSTDDAKL